MQSRLEDARIYLATLVRTRRTTNGISATGLNATHPNPPKNHTSHMSPLINVQAQPYSQLTSLLNPSTSTNTFTAVLTTHIAISPHPITLSMRHFLTGTATSSPASVTSRLAPLITKVVETAIWYGLK